MLMVACLEMTSGDSGVSSDGLSFDRSCQTQLAELRYMTSILYHKEVAKSCTGCSQSSLPGYLRRACRQEQMKKRGNR